MASLDKRANGSWTVRYRVAGKQARKTFASRREAVAFKSEIETEVMRGKALDPRLGRQSFEQWWSGWIETRMDLRDASMERTRSIGKAHLLPRFGDVRVDSITQANVQAFVMELSKSGLAPASVLRIYGVLSGSLRAAVTAGVISESPCKGVVLPRQTKHSMAVLTHQQIAELAAAHPEPYRALVVVLAYSGLRVGEAAALTPRDVDLERGIITVSKTASEINGELRTSEPKTRAGHRSIPLPPSVTDVLRDHMEAHPGPWVFAGPRGGQLRARNFHQRVFKAALRSVNEQRRKADSEAELMACRVHDLRHTAITHWIRGGVDLVRVKRWAGHESATFTVDQYGGFFPADDSAIVAALDLRRREGAGQG